MSRRGWRKPARMAEMEAAIDGGRPWQASLVALVDFLASRVAAGAAREDGGALFFNRCAGRDGNGCSMRVRRQCDAGETSLWVSPRGLGFLTGRRLGNTPLFVDAMQGVSGPVVDFACGLSGPRRPRRRKDWKVLRQICEAWQATGGAARIISVRMASGERVATAEIGWQRRGGEQVPRIVQLSGYHNRAAPAAARRAVLALLREGYPRPESVGDEVLRQLEQRQQAGGMMAVAQDTLLADILWREARRWRSVREALD